MVLSRCLAAALALVALAGALHADDAPALKDGNYIFSYYPGQPAEFPMVLIKLATKDEKVPSKSSRAGGRDGNSPIRKSKGSSSPRNWPSG